MSFNHETVLWQSSNKTWNSGAFKIVKTNHYDEAVEPSCDYSELEWTSRGHETKELAAAASVDLAFDITKAFSYDSHTSQCDSYDLLASWSEKPALKKEHERNERRAKSLAHLKELEEFFESNSRFAGQRITVKIKANDDVHDPSGAYYIYTGIIRQSGDWLTVDNAKFFNTRTNEMVKRVRSISAVGARVNVLSNS